MLLKKLPCPANVLLGRAQMADRNSDRDSAAQARVRQEDLARLVHEINELLVCRIQGGVGRQRRCRFPSEADDAERNRGEAFEVGVRIDPACEHLRQSDMLGEVLANGARAERPQHEPQFERAETASELNAGVHQIPRGFGLGRPEVLRRQRERGADDVHAPAVKGAQVERGEQPLVRVDDQRFCSSSALKNVRVRG